MSTWANIADDVLLAMGYTTDDALRHREAVLYNASIILNKLRTQELKKGMKTGDSLSSSSFLSTYIVPITHNDVADDDVTDFDACYFDLPVPIMNLDYNAGINMVRYLRNEIPHGCPPAVAKTPFSLTTLGSVYNLYQSAYQKPASDRPYVAQVQSRVYVFGVPSDVKHLLVGLYAAADFTTLDPDAPADLPPHLMVTLKKMMLDLEAWLLQIPQERLQNDGRDLQPNQTVQTRPAISVNDPRQFDE